MIGPKKMKLAEKKKKEKRKKKNAPAE